MFKVKKIINVLLEIQNKFKTSFYKTKLTLSTSRYKQLTMPIIVQHLSNREKKKLYKVISYGGVYQIHKKDDIWAIEKTGGLTRNQINCNYNDHFISYLFMCHNEIAHLVKKKLMGGF